MLYKLEINAVTLDNSPPKPDEAPLRFLLRPAYLFTGLSILFVIGFWIWFFFVRMPIADADMKAIQGRAIGEILAACNATILSDGGVAQFLPGDIATRPNPPGDAVSPFVSILEVRRNGFLCQWDGVNPAQVMRVER